MHIPPQVASKQNIVETMKDFSSSAKSDGIRIALELYQPTDEELLQIYERATRSGSEKAMLCFHFVKMYKDAARLKVFTEKGIFPKVTRSTGLESLKEVLMEDAKFPATKAQLIKSQGWKFSTSQMKGGFEPACPQASPRQSIWKPS
jgi:predicted urease superfamily metal-dependent hydrolase